MKLGGKLVERRPGACSQRSVRPSSTRSQAMKRAGRRVPRLRAPAGAELEPLDLNALVDEVLGAVRRGAGERAALARRARAERCRAIMGDAHAAAPGDPQPAAERAGRRRRAGRRPRARRHRGGAQRERRRARGAPGGAVDNGPGLRREDPASAPSSPTSRPRARARAWAWRWSRRSPTSTARACASPTSSTASCDDGRRAARGAQVSLSFSQTRSTAARVKPRRAAARRRSARDSWQTFW